MEYTLVCPNAIVVERKGLSISTYFTYDTKEEALEHKAACDQWDKELGRSPRSYILAKEGDTSNGK